MTIPTFSRVEIRHNDATDIKKAASDLRALADEMSRIAHQVGDLDLMRLAAHAAIRDTSKGLRGAGK